MLVRRPTPPSLRALVLTTVLAALLPTALLAGAPTARATSATQSRPASPLPVASRVSDPLPIEDYATYDPQTRCSPRPKAGTVALAAWLSSTYSPTSVPLTRRTCAGSVSEHKEGRALDWSLDARSAADRKRANTFLSTVFATDADGNAHAVARRMGIMYIIWNDRLYGSYRQFEARDYLASSCKSRTRCSRTLRHRDHMHISLSRPGGYGRTSWYVDPVG